MSQPLLTTGIVDSRDAIIAQLNEELRLAKHELAIAQRATELAVQTSAQAVATIKRVLDPLYSALRVLYGEMDSFGADRSYDEPQDKSAKWDAVKRNLPPRLQQAIDLLLLQGSMKRTQIAAALKMDYSNCTKNVISVLIRQGWIVDNGGSLSLKEL